MSTTSRERMPVEGARSDSRYCAPTALLDYFDPSLQALIESRGWRELPERERIGAIYDFVRDEIGFGYSADDDIPASAVLADGYGQCNTKATLLMALLRATGIPSRLHGVTVDKRLQRGIVTGALYRIAPQSILHSWAEVLFEGRWIGLEGVILDRPYLNGFRSAVHAAGGGYLGYAIGTDDLAHPPIDWHGTDTSIQSTAVNGDLGVFDDPDSFYREHPSDFRGLRGWLFRHHFRRVMNDRVSAIRSGAARSAGSAHEG